jgi:hypothetical protein
MLASAFHLLRRSQLDLLEGWREGRKTQVHAGVSTAANALAKLGFIAA